ncbi:MAG: seryl-tRNA synthetase, seryl-tRNA synthetase, partial [Candidatus Parcubacteria bacterium]
SRIRVLERLALTGDQSARTGLEAVHAEVAQEDAAYIEILQRWKKELLRLPNMPDISVPTGDDTQEMVEMSRSEQVPTPAENQTFDEYLKTIVPHVADRGENTFLQYEGSTHALYHQLEHVIYQWMYSRGYTPSDLQPGVTRDTCVASGISPDECAQLTADQVFGIVGSHAAPYVLSAMQGVALTELDALKHFVVYVPLHRSEKDRTMSLKCGLGIVCPPRHDISVTHHESLRNLHEELLKALGIPWITSVVTARKAHPSTVKTYCITIPLWKEAPSFVHVSYYHDFQARRAGITHTDEAGRRRFAHTMSSSGFRLDALLAALLLVHGDRAEEVLRTIHL